MLIVTVLGVTFYIVIINNITLFRLIIILQFIKHKIINQINLPVCSLTLLAHGEKDVCVYYG